jgi:N-acetylglucosaminyldiphosphoundecaprenol N-acetyl-beta-D-mannosaminyltransferase
VIINLNNQYATENILGYETCASTVDQLVDSVLAKAESNTRCAWLACLNPHSYVVALDDAEFTVALKDADWLVPDGAGIVLASKVLGGAIRQRITGSDIFYALNTRMNDFGNFSVFFLGASEEYPEDPELRVSAINHFLEGAANLSVLYRFVREYIGAHFPVVDCS